MIPSNTALPPALVGQLQAGRVVPFVGAGLSRIAGLPDWSALLRALVAAAPIDAVNGERAHLLNAAIDNGDFDVAAHSLQLALGMELYPMLQTILTPKVTDIPTIHRQLASVTWPAVITTNFDGLIPTAFEDRQVLTWKDNEAIGHVLRSGLPHVMMAHGTLTDPSTIVLSPQAYRESLHDPAVSHYMQVVLSQYSLLFLGYSLSDYDLKFFLEDLRHAYGKAQIPHFAFLPAAQVNELSSAHLRDNYGIETIAYEPTPFHPEVGAFVNLVIDHAPRRLLRNVHALVDELAILQEHPVTMTEVEYHERFRETCIHLGQRGFLRTASTALAAELRRVKTRLPLPDQIQTCIVVANMRLANSDVELEFQALNEYIPSVATASIQSTIKLSFETAVFKVSIEAYLLLEARRSIERTQALGIVDASIQEMCDELWTSEFLHSGRVEEFSPTDDAVFQSIRAEYRAMRGQLPEALENLGLLAAAHESAGRLADAACLRIKRAELLHKNCEDERAWTACEEAESLASHLTMDQRVAFQRNKSFIGVLLGKSHAYKAFSESIDGEIPAKNVTSHLQDLVEAESASRDQQHFASLPPLWRELRRTLREGSWGGRTRAHRRLARETLAAGWALESLHHTVLSGNTSCAQALATAVIAWRNPTLTGQISDTLMDRSSLASHLEVAAELLALLGDVIPDDLMPKVITWLLTAANDTVITSRSERPRIALWETIARMVFRCSQEEGTRILHAARSHYFIKEKGWGRKAVIQTITACARHLQQADWAELTAEVLPMAAEDKWDGDFEECLDLLHLLAQRDASGKTAIANALMPEGTAGVDVRIAALGPELGRPLAPSRLADMVARVVASLPSSVWRGIGDPPPFTLSHYMTQAAVIDGQQFRIWIPAGQTELEFVRTHRQTLTDSDCETLLTSVLSLISHPFNVRLNRLVLIQFIQQIHDRVTRERARSIMACLREIVDGRTTSPTDVEETSTTSRVRITSVSAEELQAVALRCAATMLSIYPEIGVSEDVARFKIAFLSPKPTVRRLACHALQDLKQLSPELEALLATAAQDPEVVVAATALQTIARLRKRGLLATQEQLLLVIARRASISPAVLVRQLGAHLTHVLREGTDNPEAKATLLRILEEAGTDAHYSVRAAATESAPETSNCSGPADESEEV